MVLDSKRDLASKRDFGFEKGRALPRPRLGSARLGSARLGSARLGSDSKRDFGFEQGREFDFFIFF